MASFKLLTRPIFSSFQVFQKVWFRSSSSSSTPDFIRPPGPIRSWSKDEQNAYNRWRYATNTDYRQKCCKYSREYNKKRYDTDPDWRQKTLKSRAQTIIQRYANDAEFRQALILRSRERWANDPNYRKADNRRHQERYANDPEYREIRKQRSRERYWRMKFGLPTAQEKPQNKSDSQDNSKRSDSQDQSKESDFQDSSKKSDTGL